jgi:uncharacterized membrane protein YhfC
MDLLSFVHFFNGLLMILLPVGLGIYLTRRWAIGWRLWWIGAGTFILSQVAHIPFNLAISAILNRTPLVDLSPTSQILFNAAFLGLSAGLFEELFRYGMFRWWAKDARTWKKGILTGAGHGGVEAILLGLLALYGFLQLAAVRNMDLSTLLPADQLAAAQGQVDLYWSMTWYDSLLGALERLFTIPVQIALAVIVLQCFTRGQRYWLWIAVAFHALVDATAVISLNYLGVYGTEAMVGGFCLLSLGIILLLRRPDPVPDSALPLPPPVPAPPPQELAATPDTLEDSRYV